METNKDNDMNASKMRVFFVWIPILLVLLSLVYMKAVLVAGWLVGSLAFGTLIVVTTVLERLCAKYII